MFIVLSWVKREVTCSLCKQPMPPGTRRIIVVVQLNGRKYIRNHFHHTPEKDCFLEYTDNWFEGHTYEALRGDGRKFTLDITSEQRQMRNKMLRRLSYLYRSRSIRTISTKIEVFKRTASADGIRPKDFQRYGNFILLRDEAIKTLEQTGGVPNRYLQ